jgi:hypothetical protein
MVILPDVRVLPVPARNAVAAGRWAAFETDYEMLCAPRQELWNDYKLATEALA